MGKGAIMTNLAAWLPLVLGGLIVLAICFKVFTDPALNNYIGYAMVVAVLLCAMPSIQNFTYKGQLGEISGAMKDAVAGQSANLGGDIDSVNKKLDSIIKKINAPVDVVADPSYQTNKAKEVLVYYDDPAAAQATTIRSFLLDSGYKSSSTYTDFAELTTPLPGPGSIRLVYTNANVDLANTVRGALRKKFPTLKEIGDKVVERMNSGQLQIQLF
jgi:hypothetical protein